MKIRECCVANDWHARICIPITSDVLTAMCMEPDDTCDANGRQYYVLNVVDDGNGLVVCISSEPSPLRGVGIFSVPHYVVHLPAYLGGDIAVALVNAALLHGSKDMAARATSIHGGKECTQRSRPTISPSHDTVGDHREPDHHTSVAAAYANPGGRSSQRVALGWQFYWNSGGLTDEEAAELANLPLRSCPWKRCGELREPGRNYLEYTGIDRLSLSGRPAKVWRMSATGREAWEKWLEEHSV